MEINEIKKLIDLFNKSGIGEIEVKSNSKSGEGSVRITRHVPQSSIPVMAPVAPPPVAVAPPSAAQNSAPSSVETKKVKEPKGHKVCSPMVGTAYLAAKPGDKPFVAIGQHVAVGDTLCLIEAMKMFNKIEADKAGVVSARLIENAQPVEYDQALFIITDE